MNLFTYNKELFFAIQDYREENIYLRTNRVYAQRSRKIYFHKDMEIFDKQIYKLASMLYAIYKNSEDVFMNFESIKNNPSCDINKLYKLIINK